MSSRPFAFLIWAAMAVFVAVRSGGEDHSNADPNAEKARQIQKRLIAFDSHLDIPFDYASASIDGSTQFDLPKAARGGLKGAAIAVFVPQGPRTSEGYSQALRDAHKKYELIKAIADQNPSRAELAYSPADVLRIAAGEICSCGEFAECVPLGSPNGEAWGST